MAQGLEMTIKTEVGNIWGPQFTKNEIDAFL